LELRDLAASQEGFPVLRGIDLSIGAHERVALLGPSGAGKTSLLRVLGATLLPSAGSASILGTELTGAREATLRGLRSRIGFVHQDHALVPNLRVLQNVLAGRLGQQGWAGALRSLLWPSREQKLEVLGLLEELGIGDKLFERTEVLSGGEAQRVALARALYQRPAVLLADEPIAAVDPARSRALLELMTQVAQTRGLPLVVSLHQAELAQEFFPRLVGLRAGKVVFDLPSAQVGPDQRNALYALAVGTP